MVSYTQVIPLFPLFGAAVLLVFRRRLQPIAGYVASSTIICSFLTGVTAFADLLGRDPENRSIRVQGFDWISAGGLDVGFDFHIDALGAVMILVVTGVGSLIHIYSIGYMEHDERRGLFFSYLNLFAASMLVLVMADNFALLFMGWELVGLCSYLLISFWFFKPQAAAAGKKAFVVNRVGDLGFLIGIFAIYRHFGTLDFDKVFGSVQAGPLAGSLATAIPLLLFVGAVGKSAQVPLHVWLPDAMEGPTPVSALIHAATMVTAGVYMVARAHVLFEASEFAATVVAVTGITTAFFAATIALAQDDIKRVLAYSTISQLGYMFLAVGVGALTGSPIAYAAAIFHLVTHAFFKALLFLGAGSVMHAMDDETDMKKMGGLLRSLPVTGWTFIVGWLAIIGIPPLSGFFSKDAILAAAWEHGRPELWLLGVLTAGLTALYMSRQVYLTFLGKPRFSDETHPHESPSVMTVPLVALAGLAATAGFFGLTAEGGRIFRFLEPVFIGAAETAGSPPPFHLAELSLAGIALAVSMLGGVLVAWLLYLKPGYEARRERVKRSLGGLVTLVRNKYYVDEIYGALFVWPGEQLSRFAAFAIDSKIIDASVEGLAGLVGTGSSGLRRVQSGFVRRYVMAMLAGIVVVLAALLASVR